jgi:hypothetical protein
MRRALFSLVMVVIAIATVSIAGAASKSTSEGLKGCQTLTKVYNGDLTPDQRVLAAADALTHLQKVKNRALHGILTSFGDDVAAPAALGSWCKSHYSNDATVAASAFATTTTVAPTTTAPPEFPKEVPIDSIEDSRVRNRAQEFAGGNTTVVELAPGVYADKGHAPLGPASQYSSFYGLCADTSAYRSAGHSGGGECW